TFKTLAGKEYQRTIGCGMNYPKALRYVARAEEVGTHKWALSTMAGGGKIFNDSNSWPAGCYYHQDKNGLIRYYSPNFVATTLVKTPDEWLEMMRAVPNPRWRQCFPQPRFRYDEKASTAMRIYIGKWVEICCTDLSGEMLTTYERVEEMKEDCFVTSYYGASKEFGSTYSMMNGISAAGCGRQAIRGVDAADDVALVFGRMLAAGAMRTGCGNDL
ncbi:MAG: hypothetical protein Q8M92_09435, partial [Candidatus Subteraquimicrobiales bacterium]|nr:hypothetical protein [Candidatus Subteraquimicrobiales bacterium]